MRQEGASEGQAVRAVGWRGGPRLRRPEPGVLLPSVARTLQPVLRPVRVLRERHVHGARVTHVGLRRQSPRMVSLLYLLFAVFQLLLCFSG